MTKRKLEDLNLLDDFLFAKMLSYPGIGERFAKEVLRIIFNREFSRLTVMPQKVYYGSDTDKHGARMDVYLEEVPEEEMLSGVATVYDLEPEQKLEERFSLPKRTRFYHAMIDAECLESGQKYDQLKNVVVIMILPYDPFGQDHMIYTIRNKCEELPEMPYEDGACTLFLYTRGTKGIVSQELCDFLRYMEHTDEKNANTDTLQNIQKMVRQVKRDKGVTLEYMKIFEWEERIRKEATQEGLEEGRAKGLEEGRAKGLEEGRAEGLAEGRKNEERERLRAEAAEEELAKLRLAYEKLKENSLKED